MGEKLDAVALLKADHRKVEELFADFESTDHTVRKTSIARKICAELTVHAMIEEEIFYPACEGKVDVDLLNEAYVEHDGAKVLITELESGDAKDDFFDAKVTVLKEQVEHHVREEEKRMEGIFAQARQAGLDMDRLGEALAARKLELLELAESGELLKPSASTFEAIEL